MSKLNRNGKNIIYVQLNAEDNCVLTHGIYFSEFVETAQSKLENLLLLKHNFSDADFNGHTMLSYVPKVRLQKLSNDDVTNYGEFCWIDFEEVASLNELSQQEIAELLYLGHFKRYLKTPFYNKLGNNFIYIAQNDGWFNKAYYRNLNNFYFVLGRIIVAKLNSQKIERRLLPFMKRDIYPPIEYSIILQLEQLLKAGLVIALDKTTVTRTGAEIPLWYVGDFINMDMMQKEFSSLSKGRCDAKLIYNRKTKSWQLAGC